MGNMQHPLGNFVADNFVAMLLATKLPSGWWPLDTEKASIRFMKVISLRANSHDTITIVLKDMHVYDKFICQQNLKWIIVMGDAKTYDNTKDKERILSSLARYLSR